MTTKSFRSGSVNLDGDRGQLFFLVKLPQSGGSSFGNAWAREAPYFEGDWTDPPQVSRPRVVLGGDDFRIGVHGMEYLRTSEGLVFATLDAAARALLSRGFDVLIDETSTTPETLLRYLLIDINAQPILIDTPEEECVRRALASGKNYLVEPIRQMARQKEELLKDWPAALERVRRRILERYPNDVVRGGSS